MEALDGNAIAGTLFAYFGTEMTSARGVCAHCKASAQIAELAVYALAPGIVVRCRNCGNVVIVLVNLPTGLRIDSSALQLEGIGGPAPAEPPAACHQGRKD